MILQHTITPCTRRATAAILLSWAVAITLIVMTIRATLSLRNDIRTYNARRLAARTAVQFALVAPDDVAIAKTLCPNPALDVQLLREMNQLGQLPFHCLDTNDISKIAVADVQPFGELTTPVSSGDTIQLTGWAYLADQNRPVDAVLLTTPDAQGIERVFAIVFRDREDRRDVIRSNKHSPLAQSGWARTLTISQIHPGLSISAWAYDTLAIRAHRLKGTFTTQQ